MEVHEIDESEFPFPLRVRTFIDSTYNGYGGSCIIPKGYTITLKEWREQNVNRCR